MLSVGKISPEDAEKRIRAILQTNLPGIRARFSEDKKKLRKKENDLLIKLAELIVLQTKYSMEEVIAIFFEGIIPENLLNNPILSAVYLKGIGFEGSFLQNMQKMEAIEFLG